MKASSLLRRTGVCASLLVLGLILCFSATPAWTQATSSSSIVGQITDPTGAVIPAAEVVLVDTDTQATRSATSNEAGRFIFVNVPSGNYRLKVTKEGFASYESSGLKASVGATLTVNVSLKVGATTQTVVVEASTLAELQTTTATVGSTITSNSLQFLPNMGRDVSTLAVLQPAVTANGFTAGAYMDQNTYKLDGGNISDDMAGNTIGYQTNFTGLGGTQTSAFASGVIPTPIESIEEVRVAIFNQTADFNNSSGSQVMMATKRGTNQYHGSIYGYYFATNLGAANSWVANHSPVTLGGVKYDHTPLPSNHRDRFGGTVGGVIAPKFLGGKTYAFFNYEGLRFPNVGTIEKVVPSQLMRLGVIQVPDASGKYVAYNLNPKAVTDPTNGVVYQPATCGAALCDPRGIGLNPVVNQLWSKYMPMPNDPIFALNGADTFNTQGYLTTIRSPLSSGTYTGRIDHDFGSKNRLMGSYRYLRLTNITTNQVDIGGALSGDSLGQATARAPRPQIDTYFVTGLTTNVTPNTTNDFRYAYLRQFWQWGTSQAPPQLPGLGGALEIAPGNTTNAESANALIPYNVNSQNIRQRFWDGQSHQIMDDVTMIKGNHLIQFGGSYERHYDYHTRTDNGVGINNQIVYWLSNFGVNWSGQTLPSTVPANQNSLFQNLAAEVLGIVGQTQVAYTRAGSALNIQPLGNVASNQSVIPYYNVYFSDTWHLKPTVTLTYGLAYALEMPPFELNGKQVALVDSASNFVTFDGYINQRRDAALKGQTYNPLLGFELVPNVANHPKYPYNPFYGGFSPRVAVAWNPRYSDGILGKLFGDGKTVIRTGFSQIWGRINGVNQVLVPLLGPGLLQPVICNGATMTGQCPGAGVTGPATAFRIGTDGLVAPLPQPTSTLAQPFISGGLNTNAGDSTVLDPNYKPNRNDSFSFSIQRQLSNKMMIEVGYIGRLSKHDYLLANIDAVPYMTTLGGQTFANAFANMWTSLCGGFPNGYNFGCASTTAPANVPVQPFLESALGGQSSAYCNKYSSCTVAFATNNAANIKNAQISPLWASLSTAAASQPWSNGGRTMISSALNGGFNQANSIGMVTSDGYSNYNAVYFSFRTSEWKGLTASSNFTWGRALGTAELAQYNSSSTPLTPYDLNSSYGLQNFDYKFVYNLSMYWQPPMFKGMKGWKGRMLDGWTISPLLTAQSGQGIAPFFTPTNTYGFGETSSGSVSSTAEEAVGNKPFTGGSSAIYNVAGSGGVGTNNSSKVNQFKDPQTVYSQFRPCILGIDTSCGGYYNLRGVPRWNLDATIAKNVKFTERTGAAFTFQFTNIMNHVVMAGPALSLTSPTTFGRITGQANTPRNFEAGMKLYF